MTPGYPPPELGVYESQARVREAMAKAKAEEGEPGGGVKLTDAQRAKIQDLLKGYSGAAAGDAGGAATGGASAAPSSPAIGGLAPA